MISAARFKLLALGAALALGFGGAAEARSHAPAAGHRGTHGGASFATHGGASFAMWNGSAARSAISFRSERFAPRDFAFFGRQGATRFHSAYAGPSFSSGHSGGGGVQCVTFARADTGIELSGNASSWWSNAAGVYQRGARPEAGSVLNFRANGAMRMGHVAVVNQVVNSRTIDIDHANWGGPGAVRGGISRDISVVDVSPSNDWSAVRVALGHSGEYGSIYPTYGFIYNRPDAGTMVAANDRSAPLPAMNPPPRDLRGPARDVAYDEVAEAPDSGSPAYGRHYRSRHGSHYALVRSHSGRHTLLAGASRHHGHGRA